MPAEENETDTSLELFVELIALEQNAAIVLEAPRTDDDDFGVNVKYLVMLTCCTMS